MSMIEKAARALAGWTPNVTCWEDIGEKRGDGEKLQAIYRQRARAVIEALMEPTPEMVKAAMRGRDGTIPPAVIVSIWKAMMAEALNEGEGA